MRKLFYFYENDCPGCNNKEDMVKRVMKEKSTKFFDVDCSRQKDLADYYNITRVPTFVLVDGDTEEKRHVGVMQEEQLIEFVGE